MKDIAVFFGWTLVRNEVCPRINASAESEEFFGSKSRRVTQKGSVTTTERVENLGEGFLEASSGLSSDGKRSLTLSTYQSGSDRGMSRSKRTKLVTEDNMKNETLLENI